MIQKVIKQTKNPLFLSSILMIVGTNLASFINYAYHLLMGRLLGPVQYGELVSLLSLLALLTMIPSSLNIVITKYVSSASSLTKISKFFNYFFNKIVVIFLVCLFFIVTSSTYIRSFLNLSNNYFVIMIGVAFSLAVLLIIFRSFLQGLTRFKSYLSTILVENSFKILIGVLLAFLGVGVFGALLGLLFAFLIAIFLCLFFLRDLKKKNTDQRFPVEFNELLSFSFPSILFSISLTLLFSADQILVKHFFSTYEAGIYGALSNIGRIIFYGTGPISIVMFPLISNKFSKKQNFKKTFLFSFLLGLMISIFLVVIYYLFPELIIKLMFGKAFLENFYLLGKFGIFMSFLSLSSILMHYFFAIEKTKVVILLVFSALIQIVGIITFHNNIDNVVNVAILNSGILLVILLLYALYTLRR